MYLDCKVCPGECWRAAEMWIWQATKTLISLDICHISGSVIAMKANYKYWYVHEILTLIWISQAVVVKIVLLSQ